MTGIRLVKFLFFLSCCLITFSLYAGKEFANYTVISADHYRKTVERSRQKIAFFLQELETIRHLDLNDQVAFIVKQLAGTPYTYSGMGEGDWQPNTHVYQSGAQHINQNPVYSLENLDCQTFVQVVMAFLFSENLSEFDQNILKISYGAAQNSSEDFIHFFNRNHFVDADFNPINQKNGWLSDITSKNFLGSYAKKTEALIERKNWFLIQQRHLAKVVHVLDPHQGPLMVERYKSLYQKFTSPKFISEKVVISYIPKNSLLKKNWHNRYYPNPIIFNQIPTPALAEIVYDARKWNIKGKNIKELIGTELNVGHFGIVYRQTFKRGENIYQKIYCHLSASRKIDCHVQPVTCQKEKCHELMFAHATDAYPQGFYWVLKDGRYVCTAQKPQTKKISYCNRVETIPLSDYLSSFEFGSYWYMEYPALLGIHFEKLG